MCSLSFNQSTKRIVSLLAVIGLIISFEFEKVPSAFAQVVINEFSSWESKNDWVELYSAEDVDISNWILRDTANTIMKQIPDNVSIGPSSNKYYVVDVGNRLNKTFDTIRLLKSDDTTLVNQIDYGSEGTVCAPGESQSAGRYPDGNSTIERFAASSRNSTNDVSNLSPCPIPTEEKKEAPIPIKEPTARPASTKLPPTRRPAPTIRKVVSGEIQKVEEDNDSNMMLNFEDEHSTPEALVLGINESGNSNKVSPNAGVVGEAADKSEFPYNYVLIFLGGVFVTSSFIYFFKSKFREYNFKSGKK